VLLNMLCYRTVCAARHLGCANSPQVPYRTFGPSHLLQVTNSTKGHFRQASLSDAANLRNGPSSNIRHSASSPTANQSRKKIESKASLRRSVLDSRSSRASGTDNESNANNGSYKKVFFLPLPLPFSHNVSVCQDILRGTAIQSEAGQAIDA
jgi:hypothetical protein